MATRTIKFMGAAYADSGDVSLTVSFNNVQVHNGTVTTRNEPMPTKVSELDELFTFDITTDDIGSFPLSIAVTGGVLVFGVLLGNYVDFVVQTAEDGGEHIVDGEYVVITAPEDFYGDINENSTATDGKTNITITPDPYAGAYNARPNDATETGDWNYVIADGSTFTCDYAASASRVVLTVPTPAP